MLHLLCSMAQNNIGFDQIKESPAYDLGNIYNEDTDIDQEPKTSYFSECNYYDPVNLPIVKHGKSAASYFHINCRGLCKNWDRFLFLLHDLHSSNFMFDFIGISEAFKCEGDSRIKLPKYKKPIIRCRAKSYRGGVGLFIREGITHIPRDDISIFIPNVFESIFIEVINSNCKNVIVGVVYRPNSYPNADQELFSKTLFDILDTINNENKISVIMGDINIDLLKYKTDNKTNDYLDALVANGFLPKITKPTRITEHSATLIDHIYTNDLSTSYNSGIIITDLADHFGVFTISHKTNSVYSSEVKKVRIMTDENIAKFNNLLQNSDFSNIMHHDSCNNAYNEFINIYRGEFENAFPIKVIKINSCHFKHEPWVTKGFLNSTKTKDKLYKNKLKNPNESNISEYKSFNKNLNKLKRIMKREYYRNKLEENMHNMKNTWSIINEVLGKEINKSKFPSSFTIKGKQITDKNTIANEFNIFFSEIGFKTGQQVPSTNVNFNDYLSKNVPHSMFLRPVSLDTVINTTLSLKSKTSSGHDNISTKVLKKSIISVAEPMTHIINLSLIEGKVPDQLKQAKVIPVYKSSDPTLLNNYRPISLLPAFSKLFEKIIYNKIIEFLNEFNILYQHQYGFRQKHSTVHPIIHFLNHCAESSNETIPKITLAVFCDLSKAFDVINHEILLYKLNVLGLRGKINSWLRDYLTGRRQYVQLDDEKSFSLEIKCGVPQGSILGPLLYLLYVNDICKACSCEILSFADDTTMYLSDSNIDTLYKNANVEINKLYQWFCANKLSLNATKTKYIVIRPKNKKWNLEQHSILIKDTQLTRIGNDCKDQCFKFLGLHIDEALTWQKHIKSINSKIARALFSIKQVKHCLPSSSLITLYNALIQPHLTYGIIAWGSSAPSVLKSTFVLQKRAIRLINGVKYNSHTDHLFRKNSILKLKDLYELNVTLFMHDYCCGKLPQSFSGVFKYNHEMQNIHITRQSNLMYNIKCNFNSCCHLPLFTFTKIWNKWAPLCSKVRSRVTAKKHLKRILLSEYSEVQHCEQTNCYICS